MEEKTAQVTLKSKRHIVEDGIYGAPFWVTPSRARALIAAGAVDLVGGNLAGPTETKPAGPTEVKESAGAAPASRSTDTAPSSDAGKAAPSSASQEAQASRESNVTTSPKKRAKAKKSAR